MKHQRASMEIKEIRRTSMEEKLRKSNATSENPGESMNNQRTSMNNQRKSMNITENQRTTQKNNGKNRTPKYPEVFGGILMLNLLDLE